jgi:peptide/nickel transport system permease protein
MRTIFLWNRIFQTRMSAIGKAGVLIILVMVFIALTAPLICPHSHRQISGDPLVPPNRSHFLGTDDLGVDLWAQICFGARVSLIIGLGTALLAGLGGSTAGIVAGYTGGRVDAFMMRLIDIMIVLPDLPVMIVLAAFFGPSLMTIVIVLSLFSWVHPARIIRARILSLKQRRYIHAAETYGAGIVYLMRRHFLPEIFPLAAVSMIRLTGRAIVAEAGLSFLGLGDPTSRSWGLIIHNATNFQGIYYTSFWTWWLLFPWLALTLVVTALALVGRDMEKMADPRMFDRRSVTP